MDRLVSSVERLRIYHTFSSAHAGHNSNLSISNNGGKAVSKQDIKREVRAAQAQSIKVFSAVS